MAETAKKIDYLNPVKTFPAFGKAAKEAFTAKNKGFMERVGIFFDIFQKEMGAIQEEKKEVTAETQAKVEAGVEVTIEKAKEAVKLDETKVDKADADQFIESLTYGARRVKIIPDELESSAHTGLEKLDKSFNGASTEKMDASEISAVGAVGIGVLIDLKNDSKDEKDLAKKLENLYKTSEKSAYPLSKLLKFSVLGVFNNPEQGVQIALLEKLGLKIGTSDIPGMGGFFGGVVGSVAGTFGQEKGGDGKILREGMEGIDSSSMSSSQITKAAKTLKDFFIPHTSQGNAEKLVKVFNEIATSGGSGYVEPKTMAKVAYLVDTADLNNLFEKLSKA